MTIEVYSFDFDGSHFNYLYLSSKEKVISSPRPSPRVSPSTSIIHRSSSDSAIGSGGSAPPALPVEVSPKTKDEKPSFFSVSKPQGDRQKGFGVSQHRKTTESDELNNSQNQY